MGDLVTGATAARIMYDYIDLCIHHLGRNKASGHHLSPPTGQSGLDQRDTWLLTEVMLCNGNCTRTECHGHMSHVPGGHATCGICVRFPVSSVCRPSLVLHGEISKRLATPRNTKDKKHLQSTQSAQPTNLTDQARSTTALPKGQPGRRITPINTAAVDASAQQSLV